MRIVTRGNLWQVLEGPISPRILFNTKEEAEKAAGISLPIAEVEEIDYAEEEDFDSSEESSSEEGL